MLTDAAADSQVLIVALAGPVAGERWIVDLTARQIQAEERLEAWAALLVAHARSVEGEVGDENPRLALSDARREFRPDAVITLETQATREAGRTLLVARLPGRASTGAGSEHLPTAG